MDKQEYEKELNEKWTAYALMQEALKQYNLEHTSEEKNAIKAVLRNELTWVMFIVGAVWSSVVWIILPLQKVQLQQDDLRVTLKSIQESNDKVIEEHNTLGNRLTRVESEISTLMK